VQGPADDPGLQFGEWAESALRNADRIASAMAQLRDSKFAFAPDFPADFEICPAAYDLRTESRCAFSRRMMVRS